jgi:hypothetical protein
VDAADSRLGAMLDEIFLKMHVAVARLDDGGNGMVGHGQDARFHAEGVTDGIGDLRESFAMGKHLGAVNVGSEITIAEIEPSFAAISAEPLEEMKSFTAHAPAFGGINHTGQRIGDDIEVGRDFQTVHDDVVAGVDDDGEVVRIHGMVEPEQKFRCPDTAGESSDRNFFCGTHGDVKDARQHKNPASEKLR